MSKKSGPSFVKAKHIQNKRIRGLESIAKSGLRNSEQIALMKPLSRKLRIDRETVEYQRRNREQRKACIYAS